MSETLVILTSILLFFTLYVTAMAIMTNIECICNYIQGDVTQDEITKNIQDAKLMTALSSIMWALIYYSTH